MSQNADGLQQYTVHQDGAWLPRQGSSFAAEYDAAWSLYIGVCIAFFTVVVIPVIYFAIKYKRKREDERTSPLDHHMGMEIVWTVIPTAVLFYMFWVGFKLWTNMQVAPNDVFEIKVTAQMYNWTFEYPNGEVTNDLHLPKDRNIKLVMSSKDVIHAFFVPEFRVKQDVVPNMYTTMWFKPIAETDTVIECAEYCGDGHSKMLGRVVVYDAPRFEELYANGFEDPRNPIPPAVRGKKKFDALCASCHSVDGSKIQGPTFKGVWGREEVLADGTKVTVDENYVRSSILNPQAQIVKDYPPTMPSFSYLKDKDIEGLIAFLKEQK